MTTLYNGVKPNFGSMSELAEMAYEGGTKEMVLSEAELVEEKNRFEQKWSGKSIHAVMDTSEGHWDKPGAKIPMKPVDDPVNHPSHYTSGKIEVIDFIEDQKLNYHLGNAVKYICRAGRKDPAKTVQDLEKAAWYLNRKIEELKANG